MVDRRGLCSRHFVHRQLPNEGESILWANDFHVVCHCLFYHSTEMSADVAQKPLANGLANGHVNGGAQTPSQDVEMNGTPTNEPVAAADAPRFATGLILPPPEIKSEH